MFPMGHGQPSIFWKEEEGGGGGGLAKEKQNHAQEEKEKKLAHKEAWKTFMQGGICITGMLERKFSYF